MDRVKQFAVRFSEPIVLFIIFWATQLPLRDFDIWFHIKAGEYFTTHGLIFTDPFSFTAFGRTWIAFEWLFQIISYELSRIGLWIIPPFISLFVVAISYVFLKTLKDVFRVPLIVRLTALILFIADSYEFLTARPHILAYTCLFLELSLILFRIVKGKRYIFFLPLITLFWANIHSTGFFSWGFLFTYAVVAGVQYLVTKDKAYLGQVKDFVLTGILCALVTILPPKGIRDYQLLWTFFTNRKLLGQFIDEWAPPINNYYTGFVIFTINLAVATIGVLWVTIKKKRWIENLWIVPFLIIGYVGVSATRNVLLGFYSITFLMAWSAPQLISLTPARVRKILWVTFLVLVVSFHLYLYNVKRIFVASQRLYYPVQSAQFVNKYLTGHMFNEYSYGGYILYTVYPKLQVFIDGRAEVYLCCEIHDYLGLAVNKYLPDAKYHQLLDTFWDAYTIDFAIIGVQKHVIMRRIGDLLSTDPNWALVFWDDDSEVFVKRNGKNDEIIKQLDAHAATPYLRNPFPKEKVDQALFEYERMDTIAKSARTSNALGYIYALQGDLEKAKKQFTDAIDRDPGFESPYMNLAEIAVHDGNVPQAIKLYQKALSLASDRGLIYIRLGQLTLQQSPDKIDDVRVIWEQGVKKTVDADAKTQLEQLLSKL